MKSIIIMAALLVSAHAFSQSVDDVLRSVEQNNKSIRAAKALCDAKTMEARAGNTLEAPAVAYEHMFGDKEPGEEVGKITVTQGFDFPSLYAVRSKLNKEKKQLYQREYEEQRREVLLQAKELCLDYLFLKEKLGLVREKLRNVDELDRLYAKRLADGDISIIEANKIKMQRMDAKAVLAQSQTELDKVVRTLFQLNGGVELDLPAGSSRADCGDLPSFVSFVEEAVAADAGVLRSRDEEKVASRELSAAKNAWLPSFELSYIRERVPSQGSNGIEVGMALPVWGNARNVKEARAYKLQAQLQAEAAEVDARSTYRQSYDEASSLLGILREYDTQVVYWNMGYLKKALGAGEISVIDYFTEYNSLCDILETYYSLRNSYEKAMARLYAFRL